MIRVFTVQNPYNPHEMECEVIDNPCSLDEVGERFKDKPWLCLAYIDEKQYYPKRDEWQDVELTDGDVVYFFPYIGGESILINAIISVIIAVLSYALTPDPPDIKRNDLGDADPVFNLSGEKNQVRFNQPIEDAYGRCRLWPSVGALSYNQYVNNDQLLYQLLCIGQGSYEIEQVEGVDQIFIEDTPIQNFQETEYEIVEPGQPLTLFRDNVTTSSEVGRIELFGPNEASYPLPDGWVGPFVTNEISTKADRLEVDIELPQGAGSSGTVNFTADIQYAEIDNSGNIIGSWQTLAAFNQTVSGFVPQRYTVFDNVTQGRYQVRIRRTSNKAGTNDLIQWTGLRAFLSSSTDYGDVTMLAIKARATNNLNDTSSQKFNLIATRKLPIYDGISIPSPTDTINRTATRNPVWAFINIFRAPYGGLLDDQYIDLDGLLAEASVMTSQGINFDYVFDQKSTVWEAAKLPAFVGRAVPILSGSKVTWTRDSGSQMPTFFINPENTLQNSFSLQKRLYDLNENDGLEVEYKDEDTGFKNETVLCVVGTQLGINPKKTVIKGVQSRQKAFELGYYQWAKEVYERQLITLRTGLEGYIPAYGDVVRIASDIPKWGQSGYLLEIDVTRTILTLSENVTFEAGETHTIAIRGKQGQELGPYICTAGTKDNEVVSGTAIPAGETFLDYYREPPYFVFGVQNVAGRISRIIDITPGDESIEIKAVVDDLRRLVNPGDAPPVGSTVNGYPGTVTFDPLPPQIASAYPVSVTITPQNTLATVRWSKTEMPQTATDGTEYTAPVSVDTDETLYARAFLSDSFGGLGVQETYTVIPNLDFSYTANSQYIGVL